MIMPTVEPIVLTLVDYKIPLNVLMFVYRCGKGYTQGLFPSSCSCPMLKITGIS